MAIRVMRSAPAIVSKDADEEKARNPLVGLGGLLANVVSWSVEKEPIVTDEKKSLSVVVDDHVNLFTLDRRVRSLLRSCDPELLKAYEKTTSAILESYALLAPQKGYEVIGAKDEGRGETRDVRGHLVEMFLDLAKRVVDVKIIRAPRDETICGDCRGHLEEREDAMYCPGCLTLHPMPVKIEAPSGESAFTNRNMQDRKSHFRVLVQHFQGNEDYTIEELHLTMIRTYAREYDLDIPFMTKDTLSHVIEKLGLEKVLGEHLHLVHHRLTGQSRHNIAHIEQRIYARHEEVITVFYEIKPPDRQHSLKSSYLFYQYLIMEEYDAVHPHEFPLLEMRDTLVWHNVMLRNICKILRERRSQFSWNPVNVTW